MNKKRRANFSHLFSSNLIIIPQQKTLLMFQSSSPVLSKMAIDIDAVATCLKNMRRRLAKAYWPVKIENYLRSAIFVADDCLEKFKKCEQFVDETLRLESYVRQQSKTKEMLLLINYGNRSEFESKTTSAIERLSKINCNLMEYSDLLSRSIRLSSYTCEKCDGLGKIEKQLIVRESGSPPDVIIRTFECTGCEGTGQIPMNTDLKKNLRCFLENIDTIVSTISKSINSVGKITSKSFEIIDDN